MPLMGYVIYNVIINVVYDVVSNVSFNVRCTSFYLAMDQGRGVADIKEKYS